MRIVTACIFFVTASSIAAELHPVPFPAVKFEGEFWGQRLEVIRTSTLEANRHQCDITGRYTNFDKAAGKTTGDFQGYLFNDSDVYKVIEGWSYILATDPDPKRKEELNGKLDELIARIAAAQKPDGYINTYYTVKVGLDKRWHREEHDHETYCIGHLIEAAVAHFQATGKRSLLDVAIKAADHVNNTFGPGKLEEPSGHEEIELALIKLYEVTHEVRYVELAKWFVNQRGKDRLNAAHEMSKPWGDYNQDAMPFHLQMEAQGHAVRAGYLYCAATDLARMAPDSEYAPTLDALWNDVTNRKMYITGGIGPSAHNEGFTVPYDLPTLTAYQETCASIALGLWAQRMFLLHGDASYMDAFERSSYNAILAGVSLDGSKFFYVNPLASRGNHHRQDWFGCACCPPNILRYFASIGGSFYATKGNDVYVCMYGQSEASVQTAGGLAKIHQVTGYPWDGAIHIDYQQVSGTSGNLKLRKPSWCKTYSLKVNGADQSARIGTDGFITITPMAHAAIDVTFDMPVRREYADPRVKSVVGQVAFARGPIMYTFEWDPKKQGLSSCTVPSSASIKTVKRNFASTSFVGLDVEAVQWAPSESQALYTAPDSVGNVTLEAIPYFMWDNRGPHAMQVFIPESPQALPVAPMKGIKASTSFVGNGDGVDALFDRLIPSSSNDHSIPRYTAWPHKGTSEWVQYDFDLPREISKVEVYWFDDTGVGECRIPESWEIEYLDGTTWKKAPKAENLQAHSNQFDTVSFPSALVKGLRINMKLQKNFSSGILELRCSK